MSLFPKSFDYSNNSGAWKSLARNSGKFCYYVLLLFDYILDRGFGSLTIRLSILLNYTDVVLLFNGRFCSASRLLMRCYWAGSILLSGYIVFMLIYGLWSSKFCILSPLIFVIYLALKLFYSGSVCFSDSVILFCSSILLEFCRVGLSSDIRS